MKHSILSAVYVFLFKNQSILLGKRNNTGYEDGMWSVPAGHIDGGEPATVAACRELLEETGVVAEPKDMQFVHVVHREDAGPSDDERIHFAFTCQQWQGEPKIMEPHKCSDMQCGSL